MRLLYSLLITLLLPVILLRFLWRSRTSPAYRARLDERFGLNHKGLIKTDLLIHAVSLGEARAVGPLVDALLAEGYQITLTSTTPTGSEEISRAFGSRVQHCYLPIDSPLCLRPWLEGIKPKALVLMEKELWPNLISLANRKGIPVVIANAMLSSRSFQKQYRFGWFYRALFTKISHILAQDEPVGHRFKALGATNVTIAGNLKFDIEAPASMSQMVRELEPHFEGRTLLMAACTHESEEALILDVFEELRKETPSLMLLLAPRHPDRFEKVAALIKERGEAHFCLSSGISNLPKDAHILLLDKLGVLLSFYALSELSFIGGSFVPVGGHNPLEAILVKSAVVSGNQFSNWQGIYHDLEACGGACIVGSKEALQQSLSRLLKDESARQQQIKAASRLLNASRGALESHLLTIKELVNKIH